jgi:hypothetical protein
MGDSPTGTIYFGMDTRSAWIPIAGAESFVVTPAMVGTQRQFKFYVKGSYPDGSVFAGVVSSDPSIKLLITKF